MAVQYITTLGGKIVKCLIAVMHDGVRTLLKIVPAEFNTQAWGKYKGRLI